MGTARRFAAALGLITFVTVLAFGIYEGAEVNWVLTRGLIALVIFGVIGYVLGLVGAGLAADAADGELRRKMQLDALRRRTLEEARAKAAKEKEAAASAQAGAAQAGSPQP